MEKEIVCPNCETAFIADIRVELNTKRKLHDLLDAHKLVIKDLIVSVRKKQ